MYEVPHWLLFHVWFQNKSELHELYFYIKYTISKSLISFSILRLVGSKYSYSSNLFWDHMWVSAQGRALCTQSSGVKLSAFFFTDLCCEDFPSVFKIDQLWNDNSLTTSQFDINVTRSDISTLYLCFGVCFNQIASKLHSISLHQGVALHRLGRLTRTIHHMS